MPLLHQVEQPAGRGHQDVDAARERAHLRRLADAAVDDRDREAQVPAVGAEALADLRSELARRREHQRAHRIARALAERATACASRGAARIGSANAAVLPVPVCAQPSRSRPRGCAGWPAPGSGWAGCSSPRAAPAGAARGDRVRKRKSSESVVRRLLGTGLLGAPARRSDLERGPECVALGLPAVFVRHWPRAAKKAALGRAARERNELPGRSWDQLCDSNLAVPRPDCELPPRSLVPGGPRRALRAALARTAGQTP